MDNELYVKLFIAAFQSVVGTNDYTPRQVTQISSEFATDAYQSLSRIPIDHDMLALIEADRQILTKT
jgi:hypothetical protein